MTWRFMRPDRALALPSIHPSTQSFWPSLGVPGWRLISGFIDVSGYASISTLRAVIAQCSYATPAFKRGDSLQSSLRIRPCFFLTIENIQYPTTTKLGLSHARMEETCPSSLEVPELKELLPSCTLFWACSCFLRLLVFGSLDRCRFLIGELVLARTR